MNTITNSSTEELLINKILLFISLETRTRKKLSLDTDIARDIGLDGDDAREFMDRFRIEYDVDMAEFEFGDYFGAEGFNLVRFITAGFVRKKRSITISNLVQAAKAHRWVAERPNLPKRD